ncbi:hypothetical protein ES708_32497 [subsurface metagenome]
MLDWTEVESSNIKKVGYAAALEELHIKFNSGTEYAYLEVPPEVFDALIGAPSKGKFLNAEIKGKYEYQRI